MDIRRVLLAAVLLGAAACSSNNSNSAAPSATPPPSTPAPAPASGATTTVTIPVGASGLTATAFAPNPVTIKAGDSINWVNNDNIAHTSTANNNAWNSGTIPAGGSFKTTFNTAGSFAYHCTIHPGMAGTVTVQ
jgi:plastocyanin